MNHPFIAEDGCGANLTLWLCGLPNQFKTERQH